MKVGSYSDGKEVGIWKHYNENGVLTFESEYVINQKGYSQKKGLHKQYYDSGNLKSEKAYDENENWLYSKKFYENGKLQAYYDNKECEIHYNENGEEEYRRDCQ